MDSEHNTRVESQSFEDWPVLRPLLSDIPLNCSFSWRATVTNLLVWQIEYPPQVRMVDCKIQEDVVYIQQIQSELQSKNSVTSDKGSHLFARTFVNEFPIHCLTFLWTILCNLTRIRISNLTERISPHIWNRHSCQTISCRSNRVDKEPIQWKADKPNCYRKYSTREDKERLWQYHICPGMLSSLWFSFQLLDCAGILPPEDHLVPIRWNPKSSFRGDSVSCTELPNVPLSSVLSVCSSLILLPMRTVSFFRSRIECSLRLIHLHWLQRFHLLSVLWEMDSKSSRFLPHTEKTQIFPLEMTSLHFGLWI